MSAADQERMMFRYLLGTHSTQSPHANGVNGGSEG